MIKHSQQENSIFKNVALATATLLASFFYNTAHALTDGSYTGTVSGFYEALGCSTPGFDTPFGGVSYSGATATLVVSNNGLNVTMSISQSGTFTATGVGSESGGTLNLDFVTGAGNLNIQANSTGDSIFASGPAIATAAQSGTTINIGSGSIAVETTNCALSGPSVVVSWNAFTVTVSSNIVDPAITPSSVLTTPDLLNTQITNITSTLGERIDDVLRGFYSAFNLTSSGALYSIDSGLNAGDKTFKVGAWASYSYTDFENEFTLTAFEGKRHGGLIGIDIIPWENSVWGIAGGYEKNDIETGFNRGEQDTDGYSVVSYFGALLTNTWSVDLSAGYTWLKTDQFRTDPLTNNRVSSSPDADRWFGAFNLNGLWIIDNWILGANAGALYARNTEDSFLESDGTMISSRTTRLSQVNAGGNVAYSFGNFEPFVRGSYEYDVNATDIGVVGPVQPSFDDDNFLVGGGVRYFNNRGWSGIIEYYTRLDRKDYKEENLVFTFRGEF
jgi:hypothetical protein